jgi:hypothetical protein
MFCPFPGQAFSLNYFSKGDASKELVEPNFNPHASRAMTFARLLQGICFLREAPERAIGSDRRAGKWGLAPSDDWIR